VFVGGFSIEYAFWMKLASHNGPQTDRVVLHAEWFMLIVWSSSASSGTSLQESLTARPCEFEPYNRLENW
jgi:hypothetical protein